MNVTGTILSLKRRLNTPDGNPRWIITINDESGKVFDLKTEDDEQFAYNVDYGIEGKKVMCVLNDRGRVVDMQYVP